LSVSEDEFSLGEDPNEAFKKYLALFPKLNAEISYKLTQMSKLASVIQQRNQLPRVSLNSSRPNVSMHHRRSSRNESNKSSSFDESAGRSFSPNTIKILSQRRVQLEQQVEEEAEAEHVQEEIEDEDVEDEEVVQDEDVEDGYVEDEDIEEDAEQEEEDDEDELSQDSVQENEEDVEQESDGTANEQKIAEKVIKRPENQADGYLSTIMEGEKDEDNGHFQDDRHVLQNCNEEQEMVSFYSFE
jgi:hypothetical protein